MSVDPRLFAPADLGSIYAQGQQFRAQQEDRQFRLADLAQRTAQQQAETQREQAAQQVQTLSRLAQAVRQRPLAERPALIQSLAPRLQQMGVSAEDIAGFDPSDAQLDALIALGGGRGDQPTSLQRDYEFMESIEPGLGQSMVRNRASGSPVLFDVTGDGVPDLVPREYFNQPGQPQRPAPPRPGQVMNGYRYRGGDPADRNSWEPVGQGGAGPSGPRNFR